MALDFNLYRPIFGKLHLREEFHKQIKTGVDTWVILKDELPPFEIIETTIDYQHSEIVLEDIPR